MVRRDKLMPNSCLTSSATPQGKLQLELLGAVLTDFPLDLQLLLRRQTSLATHRAACGFGLQGFDSTFVGGFDGCSNRHMPHAQRCCDIVNFHAPHVQSHCLFAPFILGLARKLSSVLLVHAAHTYMDCGEYFNYYLPSL